MAEGKLKDWIQGKLVPYRSWYSKKKRNKNQGKLYKLKRKRKKYAGGKE